MITLDSIILNPEIQKLFDYFCSGFNIIILFYSVDGKTLKVGMNRKDSLFCQLVHRIYGQSRCIFLDEKMQKKCAKEKKLIHYQCHVGIEEAVAPIFIEGQLVGYAMIGQFRSTDIISSQLRKDWIAAGYNVEELMSAFRQLPYFAPDRIKDILGMFSLLVDYIVTKEMVAVKGNLIVSKIMSYIEEHISQRISLAEVAMYVGRSASSISHLFRKTTGRSFKQSVIEAKLDKVEEYFRNTPEITIQEAALRIGFEDQFYFSRLYKKYRGISPSHYRKILENPAKTHQYRYV